MRGQGANGVGGQTVERGRSRTACRGSIATLTMIAAALVALVGAAPAPAAGAIESFSVSPSTSQAGGVPDLSVNVSLAYTGPDEAARTLRLDLPEGLNLIPTSVLRCSAETFAFSECSPSTQVGLATFRGDHDGDDEFLAGTAPVYQVQPATGDFARLGVVIPSLDLPVEMTVRLRAADHGLRIAAEDLPQSFPLAMMDLTLWGSPAEVAHDPERFLPGSPGVPPGCPGLPDAGCIAPPFPQAGMVVRPWLVNPTSCSGALAAGLELVTHQDSGTVVGEEWPMPAISRCSLLSFSSSAAVTASTEQIRSPAGLTVDLTVPQTLSPTTPSSSRLRYADVTFNGGLRLDPAAAVGIACTGAQAGFGSESAPQCPEQSEVGTVAFDGPFVPGAIEGHVYRGGLAAPGIHRLFLLAEGFGVRFKLVSVVAADPESGDLFMFSPELPQLPIERIDLDISASSGLFVTANHCGEYPVESLLSPWNTALSDQPAISSLDLTSSPGGGVCPGEPTEVGLSLAPAQTVADGASTVTATATIADKDGLPVPGDEVEFRSSDPGQAIGPTLDNGDGTYSVRITASTKVGQSTITALDKSVFPELAATALLSQGPVPPLPPASVTAPPPVTKITKRPPRRTKKRAVAFRFRSAAAGATFRCKLDRQRYRRCTSPAKLNRLRPGVHTFRVYAVDRSGTAGRPATHRFEVLKPKRKKRHRR